MKLSKVVYVIGFVAMVIIVALLSYMFGFDDGAFVAEVETVNKIAKVCVTTHDLGSGYWCGPVKEL